MSLETQQLEALRRVINEKSSVFNVAGQTPFRTSTYPAR